MPRRRRIVGVGPDKGVRPDPRLQKWLADRFGRNLFDEPRWKLIWGADWTQDVLLPNTKLDAHGNKTGVEYGWVRLPRYPELPQNCFYLARWKPGESVASPETWDRAYTLWEDGTRLMPLGARPPRGEYVLEMYFWDTDRDRPVYPTRADIELAVRLSEERIHRVRTRKPDQADRDHERLAEEQMEKRKVEHYERLWGVQVPHSFGAHVAVNDVSHAPHLEKESAA